MYTAVHSLLFFVLTCDPYLKPADLGADDFDISHHPEPIFTEHHIPRAIFSFSGSIALHAILL